MIRRLSIYLILIIIGIVVGIVIFEMISKKYLKSKIINMDTSFLYENYSNEELSYEIPKYNKRTGLNCIVPTYYPGSSGIWHSKKGFITKQPDYDCLKNHFSKDTLNVAFFGGSAMDSNSSINYLTAIDWNSINFKEKINSYNFSESGARLSQGYSHLIELVKYTTPDVAIFFDGWNEFNSLKYGGNPEDDFYWTTFYEKRLKNPWKLKLDMEIYKLILKSSTAKLLADLFKINTLMNSAILEKITKEDIRNAANNYNHYKKLTSIVCKEYQISCFFIIQPSFHNSNNISGEYYNSLISNTDLLFPHNRKLYLTGYPLLEVTENTINLTNLFDNSIDIFKDEVHFNKKGNLIVSEIFKEVISNEFSEKFK